MTNIKVPRELLWRVCRADASLGASASQLVEGWQAMAELRAILAAPAAKPVLPAPWPSGVIAQTAAAAVSDERPFVKKEICPDCEHQFESSANPYINELRAAPSERQGGERDAGLELAAQWVEKRAADYDAEHGATDPETGTREYPGDGAEYVYELEEIAEGIRALSATQQETN
jgi:hypothetical protein